jgi:hypothetical protein
VKEESSRPEAAFVLMLMQATFWFAAGLSALPFALAREIYMALLASGSFGLAAIALGLAVGLVYRRRGARRWTLALESVCLAGGILEQVLPIGANHGSVALLVNIALPAAVIVLIRGKRMRERFSAPAAAAR